MLYYLSDLSSVGCYFNPRTVVEESRRKTLVCGILTFNDTSYKALVAVYKYNKPPELIDILGKDPADAENNLNTVSAYMNQCTRNNVNGLRTRMRKRICFHIVKASSSIIILLFLLHSIYMFLSSNFDINMLPSVLLGFGLELLYFILNGIIPDD